MNKVFMFPGQGSQSIGMGKDLYNNFTVAKYVFEEVDDALSQNLSKIMFEGPEETLTETQNTQPALMAISLAFVKVIENCLGKNLNEICAATAGHSLGQYSAVCASGGMSIFDCARILKARGNFMQEACALGAGSMAAIIGAQRNIIEQVLLLANERGICDIANDNSNDQVVISGEAWAIDFALQQFKERNIKAIKLKVSSAFHSRLMLPASERMIEVLAEAHLTNLTMPVIDNTTLELTKDISFLKKTLIDQIASTVRWRETMDIIAHRFDGAVEVGAGKVLTNLFKKSYPSFEVVNISNAADIDGFLERLV